MPLAYIMWLEWCDNRTLAVSGRSETEIEYSVGFDANGVISTLDCKTWCLAGAFLDLAWNDLYGVMTGLNMVSFRACFPDLPIAVQSMQTGVHIGGITGLQAKCCSHATMHAM